MNFMTVDGAFIVWLALFIGVFIQIAWAYAYVLVESPFFV
jgi:hypothetical protein